MARHATNLEKITLTITKMYLNTNRGTPRELNNRARSTSANSDFGQLLFFRVRPIRLRPISTSANFDFGQFPLRPISISANFWMLNLGTTKCGLRRVGPRRVEAQTKKQWGAEGWEPRRVEPRRVEPRRMGGPKFRAFFSLLPPQFSFFFLSLGVLSWTFGGV